MLHVSLTQHPLFRHTNLAGIYSGADFLTVRCRCSKDCAGKRAPQLFGLEEWAQYHAKGVDVPEGPDHGEEMERAVKQHIMVLLDGDINGRQVRGVVAIARGHLRTPDANEVCVDRVV